MNADKEVIVQPTNFVVDSDKVNVEEEGNRRGAEEGEQSERRAAEEEYSQADDDDQDGYLTDENLEQDGDELLEPSQDAVNGLPFSKFFCFRLEKLWKKKREKQTHKRWKEKERLEYILPRKMLNDLNGQTIFPYLRLLLPEQDSRRQFRVKEKKIAEAYCKAEGFGKTTKNHEMLMVRVV